MTTRAIPALILLSFLSCGKDPKFTKSNIEALRDPTLAGSQALSAKQATLTKTSSGATITYGGSVYKVSDYSSQQALSFISSMSVGSLSIKFTGSTSGSEIYLQEITQ